AIVASQFIARSNARATGEANRTLAEASVSYWQGNYVRTIQLADQVLNEYGQTGAANDARRMKADALFWQGDFDSAAMLYKAYLSKDRRDGPLRTAVQTSLAYTLESKKDFAEAGKLYEEVAAKAPDRMSTADLLLAAGRSYAAAGDREKGRALYERVAGEYKETPYARDAEVALGELLAQSK
ncbi:MAG: tetratricopeptide repeat protein, partial [Candidatus Eiseniibacteriota bacterium]